MRPSLLRLQPSLSQVAAKYQIPRGDFPEVERFRARLLDGEYVYSSTINCIATVHDQSHSSRSSMQNCLASPCHAVPCLASPRLAVPGRALPARATLSRTADVSVVLVVLCGSYDISKFPSLCANSPHNLVALASRFHRPLPLRTAHYLPRSPLFGRGRAGAERAVLSPGIGR
jgi:hypothetical protein